MFKDEVFLGDDFNAEAFVKEQRRGLTLNVLRKELEEYVENLDNSLVNIINNDYSAFLRLSSMLVDIDALVAGLRGPLDQLENKVVSVRDVVSAPLATQEELLNRLLYVQEKKKVIQLCLSAWETLEKVESQVQQLKKSRNQEKGKNDDEDDDNNQDENVPQNNSTDDDDEKKTTPAASSDMIKANGEALGRATQRLSRVSFLAQENSSLPLLRMIRAKARSLEHSLIEELDKAFVEAVLSERADAATKVKSIAVVLRAYVAINQGDQAAQVFKNRVVKPYLQDLLTQGRLDAGGNRGEAAGLKEIYRDILRFVQKSCKPVLDAVRDPEEGLGDVDFIGTSVCQGVSEMICEKIPQIYTSGSPTTLHLTYTTTEALFRILESFARRPELVRGISARLLSMWNLSVYIQLRHQEMFKALEVQLAGEIKANETNGLYLNASVTLLECVDNCWSNEIFLAGVSSRIFKLVLELITRYWTWASQAVQYLTKLHGAVSPPQDEEIEEEDPCVKSSWGVGLGFDAILYLVADCRTLSERIGARINLVQQKLFPEEQNHQHSSEAEEAKVKWEQGREAVARALQEIIPQKLTEIANQGEEAFTRYLVSTCQGTLTSGMKSVAPLFRTKNKPTPTGPSPYTGKVFEQVNQFLNTEEFSKLLSEDDLKRYMTNIFGQVVDCFEENGKAILEEVKNSENALRRIKRSATNQQLGSEKIQVQFKLDLEDLAGQAEPWAITFPEKYNELIEYFAN